MKGIILKGKTILYLFVIEIYFAVMVKCDESTKRCFEFSSDWLYTPGYPGNTTLTLSACSGENSVILIKSATFMRPDEIGDNCFTSCCLPTSKTCTADIKSNHPQVFRDIEFKCNGKQTCQVSINPAPMDSSCGKSSEQQCDSYFRDEVLIPQMNPDESQEFIKYYDYWCWSRKVEIVYACVHPDQVPTQIISVTNTPSTTSTTTETATTSSSTTLPTTTTTTESTTVTTSPTTSTSTTTTTTTPTTTSSTTESITSSSTTSTTTFSSSTSPIKSTTTITTPTTTTTTKEKSTLFIVEFDKSVDDDGKTNINANLQPEIPTSTILPKVSSTQIVQNKKDIIDPNVQKSVEKSSTGLSPSEDNISVVLVEEPPIYVNVDESDVKPTSPKKKDSNAKFIAVVAGACVLALVAICAVTVVIHIMLRRRTAKMIRKSSLKQPKRDNAAIMQTMNTLRQGENSLRYGEGPSSNVPVTHDLITFDRNSRLGSMTHSQGCARSFNGCDMVDNTYYEADDITKPSFPPPCHPDQKQIINDIILSNYTIKQPVKQAEKTITDPVYYELCEDAANQSACHIYNDVPNSKITRDSEDYYESSDDYQSSKSSDKDCPKLQSIRVNMPGNYSGDDEDYYESSDDETKQQPKLSQVHKNLVNNNKPTPRSVHPSKSSDYDYAYDHFEFEGRVRAK